MPLLKLGEKRYYLGIFFKVSRLPVTLIYLVALAGAAYRTLSNYFRARNFPACRLTGALRCIERQTGLVIDLFTWTRPSPISMLCITRQRTRKIDLVDHCPRGLVTIPLSSRLRWRKRALCRVGRRQRFDRHTFVKWGRKRCSLRGTGGDVYISRMRKYSIDAC